MRSDKYWTERMVSLKKEAIKDVNVKLHNLRKRYSAAYYEFYDKINKIYHDYAEENGILNINLAKEFLSGAETDITLTEYMRLVNGSLNEKSVEAERILQGWAKRERITRLEQIQLETDAIAVKLYSETQEYVTAALTESAKDSFTRSMYELQKGMGAWSPLYSPSDVYFRALSSQEWAGKNYSARLWGHYDNFSATLKKNVEDAFINGYSVDETVRRLNGELVADRKNVERLVRTEMAHVQEQATLISYEDSGITKYKFVSTLDLKTSSVCRSLDGKVFDTEAAQSFTVDYGGKNGRKTYTEKGGKVGINYPPMHPYCRSTTVPYAEGFTAETRSARDPVTDKKVEVDGKLTYAEWYEKYVKGNPEAMLNEKKLRRLNSDKAQHERYKKLLKDCPKSFAAFIDLKYAKDGDVEPWLDMQRKYRDTRQLKKYKDVLGKEAPKDLETLQDIKYNKGQGIYYETDYRRRKKLIDDPELALPNAEKATAADGKFTKYLFNGVHHEGLIKGEIITKILGYDINNWQEFRKAIYKAKTLYPSYNRGVNGQKDGYSYEQYYIMYGKKGRAANLKVGWNVVGDKTTMNTIYIEELKKKWK